MKKFSLLLTLTAFTLTQQVSAESISAVTDPVHQSTVTSVEEVQHLGKGIPSVSLLGIFNSTAAVPTTVQMTIWDPESQDGSELGTSKTFQVCKTSGELPVIESANISKTNRRGESVLEIRFRYTVPSLGETPEDDVDVSIVSSLKVAIKAGTLAETANLEEISRQDIGDAIYASKEGITTPVFNNADDSQSFEKKEIVNFFQEELAKDSKLAAYVKVLRARYDDIIGDILKVSSHNISKKSEDLGADFKGSNYEITLFAERHDSISPIGKVKVKTERNESDSALSLIIVGPLNH